MSAQAGYTCDAAQKYVGVRGETGFVQNHFVAPEFGQRERARKYSKLGGWKPREGFKSAQAVEISDLDISCSIQNFTFCNLIDPSGTYSTLKYKESMPLSKAQGPNHFERLCKKRGVSACSSDQPSNLSPSIRHAITFHLNQALLIPTWRKFEPCGFQAGTFVRRLAWGGTCQSLEIGPIINPRTRRLLISGIRRKSGSSNNQEGFDAIPDP